MKTSIGTVYNVRSKNATKSPSVGDYNTLNEAKAAMLKHYTVTPKRGKFEYIINEEKLYDIDGIKMRMFEISLSGGGTFYKCYTRSELDAIIGGLER